MRDLIDSFYFDDAHRALYCGVVETVEGLVLNYLAQQRLGLPRSY